MESGFDLRVEKFSDAWEHTHLRVPRTGAAAPFSGMQSKD
jgi:hypothetical protein